MAGRGKIDPTNNSAHPRVLKLDRQNRWVVGTDPLHFDKPTIAGVGPGSGFGPAMAEANPEITIGLVPCAFGGTPLSRWEKDGDLYKKAIIRARIAMKSGVLKGVLWHQGESDSKNKETTGSYGKWLEKMIGDLRNDLSTPDLPFVMGELGHFLDKVDRLPFHKEVNAAINAIPSRVKHTAVAKADDLQAKSDQVHSNAKSAQELGRRYAKAMQELQKAVR